MKISLFCTYDDGGAGKAALRLNNGLNRIGEDSTLFVKWKTTNSSKVVQIDSPEIKNKVFDHFVRKNFITNIRDGNTISSAMYPSIGFEYLNLIQTYDIVNLHWIPTFVSLESISQLRKMGKPIVWTLHDQNPMTGACHYTHGCDKYKFDCSNCPQLKVNINNIAKVILKAKCSYLPKDLVVVTPSQWLADCARQSVVFKNHRVEVIPNSLETDIFKPLDKEYAKNQLGLPPKGKVILFGAQDLKEKRKGLSELIEAIKHMKENNRVEQLIARNELHVLTFGHSSSLLDSIGIPYKALGYINENSELSIAYSAADVLALPSLEDNLPNLMIESLACETPVVAFNIGGMADVIKDGKNGYLVPLKDTKRFGNRLLDVLISEKMSLKCRGYIEENFKLEIQAQRYKDLFSDIVKKTSLFYVPVETPVVYPEIAASVISNICESAIEVQNEWDQLVAEKMQLIDESKILKLEQEKLKLRQSQLCQELQNVYQSKSWKITMSFKIGYKGLKRIAKYVLPFGLVRYYQKRRE